MTAKRSRIRGKSTQLTVDDNGKKLKGEEAGDHIVRRLGLDTVDFRNTCYFEQRRMARFVTADPGERMKIIASWFKLEPLQRCESRSRDLARLASERVESIQATIRAKRAYMIENYNATRRAEYEGQDTTAGMLCAIDHMLADSEQMTCHQRSQVDLYADEVRRASDALAEWQKVQDDATEYARARARGVALKAGVERSKAMLAETPEPTADEIEQLTDADKAAERTANAAFAAHAEARREATQKKSLAAGEFDGTCPIAGIACPAKDEINAPRKRNLALYDEAEAKAKAAQAAYRAAAEGRDRARADLQAANARITRARDLARDVEKGEGELTELRRLCERLAPAAKRAKEGPAPSSDSGARRAHEDARKALLDAETGIRYLERARTTIVEADKAIAELEESLKAALVEAAIAREAIQVFGRNGAQKRVAEGNLATIEEGANDLLRTCGIDLSIAVQWAREGNGLADECEQCGSPFPSSARVKTCARCKAERGPKTVNKLDLVLSERSGAAEDLAGIAFQLSASAWLRNDRGSAWGTACVDEPFSAMDTANRRALATHFATMLRGAYGYEQSFIVAHNRDIMESLPARIEIFATAEGSRLKVIG